MGNAATSGSKRDRNFSYSIDNLPSKQNSADDHKNSLDYGKKQFLYQQSIDTTDDVEDFNQTKVGLFGVRLIELRDRPDAKLPQTSFLIRFHLFFLLLQKTATTS